MTNDNFTITEEKTAGGIKLHIAGRINAFNATTLQYKLDDTLRAGLNNIILNMSQVLFLVSAGIRVLLMTYKKAEEAGGRLSVERPSENVRNVLGITALSEMLIE